MFMFESVDNRLRQYGNGVYEEMSAIAVNDDGSFELSEELSKKFRGFWKTMNFTDRGEVGCYNMTIMGIYFHLFNPVSHCCGININCIMLAVANRISVCNEKITSPKDFWNALVDYIKEHSDWIDNIKEKNISCDIEAEICYSFAEMVINVLKKGE